MRALILYVNISRACSQVEGESFERRLAAQQAEQRQAEAEVSSSARLLSCCVSLACWFRSHLCFAAVFQALVSEVLAREAVAHAQALAAQNSYRQVAAITVVIDFGTMHD